MLAIVVAVQFMFGVDAYIVNVAIPTIVIEPDACSAEIEAVIAICLIADATLVVAGAQLGVFAIEAARSAGTARIADVVRALAATGVIFLSWKRRGSPKS